MVDSRQKGARAESAARDVLVKYTGLNWKRTPGSGALSADHMLKGDLYIPEAKNIYCVEVKHYKEDQINTKLLTGTNTVFEGWWKQAHRQANQVNKKPLLIFKHDRSKWFVGVDDYLDDVTRTLYVTHFDICICRLEEWLLKWKPRFIE